MKHLKSTKKSKHTRPLPMGKKSRRVLAVYAAVVFTVCCLPMTAFAAGNDPLAVINNLSDFIFSNNHLSVNPQNLYISNNHVGYCPLSFQHQTKSSASLHRITASQELYLV